METGRYWSRSNRWISVAHKPIAVLTPPRLRFRPRLNLSRHVPRASRASRSPIRNNAEEPWITETNRARMKLWISVAHGLQNNSFLRSWYLSPYTCRTHPRVSKTPRHPIRSIGRSLKHRGRELDSLEKPDSVGLYGNGTISN